MLAWAPLPWRLGRKSGLVWPVVVLQVVRVVLCCLVVTDGRLGTPVQGWLEFGGRVLDVAVVGAVGL